MGEDGQPPEDDLSWHQRNAARCWAAEDAAGDAVEAIMQRVASVLDDRRLDRERINYAALFAMAHIANAMQFSRLVHDAGEASKAPWIAENEPSLLSIDSWATGAVKLRKPGATPAEPEPPQQPRLNVAKRRPLGRSIKADGASSELPPGGTAQLAGTNELAASGELVAAGQRRDAEIAHAKQIRAIEAMERKEQARLERAQQREREEQEQHQQLLKDLQVTTFNCASSNLFSLLNLGPGLRHRPRGIRHSAQNCK